MEGLRAAIELGAAAGYSDPLDRSRAGFVRRHPFDNLRKRYQYAIWNAPDRPVFFHGIWSGIAGGRWIFAAMQAAANVLMGEHDFASFARPGHGREHTIRTIHSLAIHARLPRVVIGVEGSGFLWQMVRIIVGTLVEVGIGRYGADEVKRMLEAKDREAAGPTAPRAWVILAMDQDRDEPEHGEHRSPCP